MTPLPPHLLPDNASVDRDGSLILAGCRVDQLAREFGTPLFLYDEDHLRARCREAVRHFGGNAAYASKAFLCREIARLVAEEGMRIDVASAGERYVCRSAGVPANRLILHGNNKSRDELRYAIEEGVFRIVVDSTDELDRLEALHQETGCCPRVHLRITPGVEAYTHRYISTGQDDSKFGFTLSSGKAAEAIERAKRSDAIELMGIHAHIGSQVFESSSFAKIVGVMADLWRPLGLPELSIGGGLGVPYVTGESAPTLAEWAQTIQQACREHRVDARLMVEPGRSIAAGAAMTLYTVGTIKDLPGIRTYVAVDGGMSDNPRPILYGSGYETFLPRAVTAERPRRIRLVGKHCESGDVLVLEGAVPADLAVGDLIATPVTGAYGHSMASNYNKALRPAVVFVRNGEARLVVRRERLEDLVRLDC